MSFETTEERIKRILGELKEKYPFCKSYDMSQSGEHFVCEIEPVEEHPEYDRAIEVIIKSKPHKHLKMVQKYKIIKGALELHDDNKTVILQTGDTYTISPGNIHWAKSNNESWVEIYSEPGWTQEDHIPVSQE